MSRTFMAFIALGGIALGQDPGALQQSAARQEQLRGEARQLVARLDGVLSEYARNGLEQGEDFEVLKGLRGQLGSLSDKEMEQVVALLTQAGTSQGPRDAMGPAVKAYTGQKEISLRLKQILAAHERRQDLDALAQAVSQLADRQAANLGAAKDVRQLAAQDKSANGQAAVAASEQAQQGEQAAIAGEVNLSADKLARIAKEAEEAGEPKYNDVAAQLAQVQPRTAAAADALGAGKIDDAAAAETAARDQLAEIARTLAPVRNPESPAAIEARQLVDIAHEQRALLDTIKGLNDRLQHDPAATAALRPQMTALAANQAALAAKAQIVREDLQQTVKDAAAAMANALTDMNSAQDALSQAEGNEAAEDQADAANQLDQAARLAQQDAANPPQAAQAASREQTLRQLQKAVDGLAARETAAIQQGDARKTGPMAAAAAALQQDMAGETEGLQETATAEGSASAQALQDASGAMQTAAQAMHAPDATQAQAAQQAAMQNLGAAAQQLGQEADAAAREPQQLANAERQLDTVGSLIREQQNVNLDTAKALEKQQSGPGEARELGRQQARTRKDTEDARQAVDTAPPDAAKALDQADTAMGDAAQKMDAREEQQAQPPEQAALAALYHAQDALADQVRQLAQDLGQPMPSARTLQDEEAELGRAQEDAASAQEAMPEGKGNANMGHAAAQLDGAARRMAEAGRHPQGMPQATRDAVREAEQALAGAAEAAKNGNGQQARAQAGRGRQAIAAAQSALAQMQAGIAGLAPVPHQGDEPGQGQPNQPQSTKNGRGTGAKERNWNDQAGTVATAMQGAHGAGQFLALPQPDRAAVQQSQSEKYPQEYGSMIEEYMRSLASDSGGK